MAATNNKKSGCSGFSLIELLITMAVMGIVLGIATLNFNAWQAKNRIEAQIHEIFVDLNETRTSAFTQKVRYGIIFQPDRYEIKSFNSEAEANDPLNSGTRLAVKRMRYGITKAGASIVDTPVVFDTSGVASDSFTIFVNENDVGPNVSCIAISTTRVNVGRINGTACVFK
ncbi:MAG: pilus assembly FimT family protein [Desulfuromonadaceae bacterium]